MAEKPVHDIQPSSLAADPLDGDVVVEVAVYVDTDGEPVEPIILSLPVPASLIRQRLKEERDG